MDDKLSCPFCGSFNIRLREGLLRVRIMPEDDGEPDEARGYLVYRCLACGRGFDEIEAEGPAPGLSRTP